MKQPVRKPRREATPEGKTLLALGKKWLDRVNSAEQREKRWLTDAKKAVQAYTNEAEPEAYADKLQSYGGYDFNILFSNVETIVPAVINSPPVPDIRRRFGDADPAARVVADIIERAISVQVDDSRLQTELESQAQDAFLAGRGVIRLRFYSDIVQTLPTKDELEDAAEELDPAYADRAQREDEEGENYAEPGDGEDDVVEHLENERIRFEAVSWVDYRHGPAKRWEDRPWEAFRFTVELEDEASSFNQTLMGEQLSDSEIGERADRFKDGITGWEIWDKSKRRVIFVDDNGVVLKMVDDPLGLSGFFSAAEPVQPVTINGRLMPVCPFSLYRVLANKLDDAVRRKSKLIDAMKAKGWYGISETDMQTVTDLNDNEFAPVASPEIWAANGGIQNAIAFWPIEKFVVAIQQLDAAIEKYKQWIYEITGISDIVRGASMASETATAQNIKSQWGSLRIQKMQRLMERCARDLFVMMAEIIPTKFSVKTLEMMTGIEIQVTPNDPPEKVQEKLQVQALMQQKLSAYYRINVETDSTVRADLTRQKQEVSQFLQGASAYFAAVAPLVQQGALPAEAAVEIFAATARMFNLGKSVEDTLEGMVTRAKDMAQQAAQQPPQEQQPDPAQQAIAAKAEAETQRTAMETQMKGEQHQFDMQRQAADLEAKMAESARKAEVDGAKAQRDAILGELDAALKKLDLQIRQTELQIKQTELANKAMEPAAEAVTVMETA